MQSKTPCALSAALPLIFLLLISFVSASNELTTEHAAITHLKTLENDTDVTPSEVIGEVDDIFSVSQQKNWTRAEVWAQVITLNFLIELEDINAAKTLSEQIQQHVYLSKDEELKLRYDMSKLYLLSSAGTSETLHALRTELTKAIKLEKHQDLTGQLLYSLATSYIDTFEYTDAIQHLHAAFKNFDLNNDKNSKGNVLSTLGIIYADLGNFGKASEYFEQSIAIAREYGNKFDLSVVLFNQASTQVDLGNYDTAESIFLEARKISDSIDDQIGVAWVESLLVEIEVERENWENALAISKGLQQKFKAIGDDLSLFTVKLAETNAHLALENYESANILIQEMEALLPSINSPVYENQYYYTLSVLRYSQGNFKEAYDLLERSSEFQFAIYEEDRQKQIQRYAVEFDTTFQEMKNDALEKDNNLQQLKIQRQEDQKKYWIFLVLFILSILVIAFLLLAKQIHHRNLFKALALKDPLTESPNRRAILQIAQDKLASMQALSIAIVDIDHFKRVNDNYGHDAGDNVLKAFSIACNKVLRKHDHFGRYGGEEWLFVLNDTSSSDFDGIFTRLRNELNASEIPGIPSDYKITFSMGIAICADGQKNELRDLINQADTGLYTAKESGRNHFVINNSSGPLET